MSSKSYFLTLSEKAIDDLIEIQTFTFLEFGESQWSKYHSILIEAFQSIQFNPFIGHKRSDIPTKYLSWPVGEHNIIYRIEATRIYVVRVLHSKMDFRNSI